MKLKQKLLVGLLAVGFASGAQADIALSSSGDGSLYASVSNGATSSAVFDLGFVLSSFLPSVVSSAAGTTYTWNLDASLTPSGTVGVTNYGTIWDSFAATVTDWSVVSFDVAAGDSTGSALGSDRYLTTSVDDINTITLTNNLSLSTFGAAVDTTSPGYITSANANDTGADNGASLATTTSAAALFADGKGDSWQTLASWDSTQTVGQSVDFFYVSSSASSLGTNGGLAVNAEQYVGTWLLTQDGVLTYSVPVAAVPEADTWAMFAAGLLAVGAIARRRMQA